MFNQNMPAEEKVRKLALQTIGNIQAKQNFTTDLSRIIAVKQLQLILSIETLRASQIVALFKVIYTSVLEKGNFGLRKKSSSFIQAMDDFFSEASQILPLLTNEEIEHNATQYSSEHNAALILQLEKALNFFDDQKIREHINELLLSPEHSASTWLAIATEQSFPLANYAIKNKLTGSLNWEDQNSTGYNALQYAVMAGNVVVTSFLLTLGANEKIKDRQQNTLLHLAVANHHIHMVAFLMNYLNANDKNIYNLTPFDLAISNKFEDIALLLLPKVNLQNLKDFRKKQKEKIIQNGPISPLPEKNIYTPVEAIESQIYANIADESALQKFRSFLVKDCESALLLRPLLELMGLASLGKHVANKNFKAIICPDNEYKGFNFNINAGAFYSGKNTIFLSSSKNFIEVITLKGDDFLEVHYGVFLHEATHFIMKLVFENECNPFFKNDIDAMKEMQEITKKLQQQFLTVVFCDEDKMTLDDFLRHIISSIFSKYKPREFMRELIVKVPEIIGLIGYEKGMKWLKENVPELLNFYENHVNSHIVKYLLKHNAGQYIETKFAPPSKKENNFHSSFRFFSLPPEDSCCKRVIAPAIAQ